MDDGQRVHLPAGRHTCLIRALSTRRPAAHSSLALTNQLSIYILLTCLMCHLPAVWFSDLLVMPRHLLPPKCSFSDTFLLPNYPSSDFFLPPRCSSSHPFLPPRCSSRSCIPPAQMSFLRVLPYTQLSLTRPFHSVQISPGPILPPEHLSLNIFLLPEYYSRGQFFPVRCCILPSLLLAKCLSLPTLPFRLFSLLL